LDDKFAFDEEVFVQYASSLLDVESSSIESILFDASDKKTYSWSNWRSWVNFSKTTNFLTLDLPVWLSSATTKDLSQGQKSQFREIYGRVLKVTFGLSSQRGWETVLRKSGSSHFEWGLVR